MTFLVITLILVAAIAYVSLFGFNLFGKLSYDGILDPDGLNKASTLQAVQSSHLKPTRRM